MIYRAVGILVALLSVFAIVSPATATEEGLKQLSANGITVHYPATMEVQAKRILEMAVKQIQPSVGIHRQIIALLADPGAIATDIADLLGSEEVQDKTRIRLSAFKLKSEALVACFSNIRLISTADAVAKGGVDAGVIQVRYVKDTDEFKIGLDLENANVDAIKRGYFPIFVNADGSIRVENKIPEMALDFLGSGQTMLLAPIHEVVIHAITQQLNLYHPFTRWFTEGVSGWVTRRVVGRLDPKLVALADQAFLPGPAAKKLRDKINLLAWPQSAFQNFRDPAFDPTMEAAHSRYSVEVISNMLGGNRGKTLARIISEIKYNANADTNMICEAIKKVTGTDFKKTLMTYVSQDIRDGISSGKAKKLIAQAEKLVQEKKWKDAATKLRRALQMAPDDVNARLNLAWIEREFGERIDSEIQVFTAARLLGQAKYSFSLFAPSLEGNYIVGRLAILLGNLEYARKLLEPVLAAKPDHVDARRAMAEIKAIESAAKGNKG